MTLRQKVLKAFYPVFMWWKGGKAKAITNVKERPVVSFYSLTSTLNNGQPFNFETLRGKKVLLVNTASDCGFTNQYEDLQKLYEQYMDKLIVIGFPANDFKEQERGTDEEIARFCKVNFGVTFPLMKKSTVIKSENQNKVFKWLSDSLLNGWNDKQPPWNFSKYLVNERGELTNYFDPSISPLSNEVLTAILAKEKN
ncbi:MAG TPA: glutathione peroxidase [Chitinophagaceae bacterium]|nr:glutathione peroxidase [Chitinophagaceae bacterium]